MATHVRSSAPGGSPTLDPLRDAFSPFPSPIVVFNKSHSGSRVVSALLAAGGVFMGTRVSESGDSLDLLDLVAPLIGRYHPDYAPLWDAEAPADEALRDCARSALERHLEGFDRAAGRPWGWKLCETTYVLPVIDFVFPRARYIHLIRDGRDVAFADHHGPSDDWWRRLYFGTDRMRTWQGHPLTGAAYRGRSPLFNALHWVGSVTIGRHFAMMLRDRCIEVRYEDLCTAFRPTAMRVLEFAGAPDPQAAVAALEPVVHATSVGKHRTRTRREQHEVVQLMKPLLLSLGYLGDDPEPEVRSAWRPVRAALARLGRLR